MKAQPQACAEKVRLASELNAVTTAFSNAVRELHERMGTCSKEQYEPLLRNVDDLRMKLETTRLSQEKHLAAHGC